jgi:hypothetical protein
MSSRKTTEHFIAECKAIHGDKYDYSHTKYVKQTVKVIITCHEHGDFEQLPSNHLCGKGCMKCSGKDTLTTDDFIQRATVVHGNRYDYSNVVYCNNKTPVRIICAEHGEFFQMPNKHISSKHGCPKCANNQRRTTKDFVLAATKVHQDRYNYSMVDYTNNRTKVQIICHKHGLFEQTPEEHLGGANCPKCVYESMFLTTEIFITRSRMVHGNKYDYNLVSYEDSTTKVKIICPQHGLFEQRPLGHLQGRGCPSCSMTKKQNDWLSLYQVGKEFIEYKLQFDDGVWVRVDGFDPHSNTVYEFYGDYWHGNPEIYHPTEINRSNKHSYGDLFRKTIERERKIINGGYNLVYIWETDFDKIKHETAVFLREIPDSRYHNIRRCIPVCL